MYLVSVLEGNTMICKMMSSVFLRKLFLIVVTPFLIMWLLVLSATPVSAQAVNYTGPTDPTTRYVLENSITTSGATTINVPVYFPAQPTSAKVVNVNSFIVGNPSVTARFNGGAGINSNGSFSIPAGNFSYDPVAALWKANINVVMQGGTASQHPSHFIHFRMQLADTSGYISYGGGYFQAASVDYPVRNTSKLYSLYMATPCDINVATARNVQFFDLDHEDYDNGDFPVTVRITDITTGSVVAIRDGDSYDTSMGNDDTLTIGMTFVPGHKYRVDLWDIAPTNVIQYNFPFDNIAYVVPICPKPQWNTDGSSNVSPSGVVTTTTPSVTFTHTILNRSTSSDPTDKTINAEIFQTVNGGAPTSRGTFSRASGLPPGGNFSRTDSISTAGNIGNVVCQYVRWSPVAWNNSGALQTQATCVTIASLPRMSIVGGDAASGGNFACTSGGGGFQGSAGSPGTFGEYGLLSTNNIVSFYSGGLSGGRILTFANAPITNPLGNFSSSRCLTNLAPGLIAGASSWNTTYSGGALPSGGGSIRPPGDVNISASTLNAGGKWLIDASGRTVTISGNLSYASGPFAKFSEVPSLIIIADNIVINSNVTQIDGLFIANQNMTTCSNAGLTHAAAAAATASMAVGGACRNASLTVNGALIVGGQLVTARSIGGDTPTTPPAEIVRFRPEVFLSPYENGEATGSLNTDLEIELPPRN